jgi:uncharacterized surface protein with fasciclin (FAS1) repeats
LSTRRVETTFWLGRQIAARNFEGMIMKSLMIAAGAATALLVSAPAAAQQQDIVDTAVAAGQFNTLTSALRAAGLVETLKGAGPFTVFAPTDAAFAKLPQGTLETLMNPDNRTQLRNILTYHVVQGVQPSSALAGQTVEVPTVNGANLRVDGTTGVKVNDATVSQADIAASNGVIHVIDTVLLPPAN